MFFGVFAKKSDIRDYQTMTSSQRFLLWALCFVFNKLLLWKICRSVAFANFSKTVTVTESVNELFERLFSSRSRNSKLGVVLVTFESPTRL